VYTNVVFVGQFGRYSPRVPADEVSSPPELAAGNFFAVRLLPKEKIRFRLLPWEVRRYAAWSESMRNDIGRLSGYHDGRAAQSKCLQSDSLSLNYDDKLDVRQGL